MTAIILLAIVLSIALGYLTKINIGFFAIVFAYLIGAFGLDLSTSDIIDMWPIQIFFVILTVTLFYGFAMVNGTLEKVANRLLFWSRKIPWALPMVIFLVATVIAAMGAGFYTVLAFMAPMALMMSVRTGISSTIAAMAVNYGALAGANFMTSQSGVIFRGLMEHSDVSRQDAFSNATAIFVTTMIVPIVVIGLYMLFFRKHLNITIEVEEPEPFDRKQKQTLTLVLLLMGILLIVPMLAQLIDNSTLSFIADRLDISFLAMLFTVIALLLRLGDQKAVLASVPWNTLLLISGVGMLIEVAIEAGVIDLLSEWVSTSIPIWLIPLAVTLIAAFMSVFASTLGVVTPALFPIVPAIASATGISPVVLFVCIVMGSQATAISPFSSGGSLVLGSRPHEIGERSLMNSLLFRAIPAGLAVVAIGSFIVRGVLSNDLI
jgi:di/tricarboxylate transporter